MKRLCLLPLAVLLAFLIVFPAFPSVGLAQDEITVISSSTLIAFPYAITFNLEAESSTQISDIDLEYRLERLSLVPVSWRVDVDFTPGLRVNASWTWNMLESGGLPPGAEIDYWWLIEDAAGHKIETLPSTLSFDDPHFDGNSLTSDQITLYWYQGDQLFAQELMAAAGEALQRLASDTGVSLERSVRIYIYASFGDLLSALIYPYEWTGGVAFTEYGIIAIGISPYDLAWGQRAIAHELAHLVVHQATFGPFGLLPRWLDEGLAVYAEGEMSSGHQSRLNEAISEDRLISVRSLSSSFPTDPDQAKLSYAESYSLVLFLLDNYGQGKMLELLHVFKEGTNYDDALTQVYGFDMDGLNELWRASLGLGPQPIPTPGEPGELFGCAISLKSGEKPYDTRGLIGLGVLLLLPALALALHRVRRGK